MLTSYRPQEEQPGRSPSQDEYFQFDMGEDDLFGAPEDTEELYDGFDQDEDEEDSSSSGCEPDMVGTGYTSF